MDRTFATTVECVACAELVTVQVEPEGGDAVCPACGVRLKVVRTSDRAAPGAGGREPGKPEPEPGKATRMLDYGTMFQPGLMLKSIFAGKKAEPAPAPSPPAVDAFLTVLGAPPGQEPLRLGGAVTVLGRQGADLAFDDPSISARHCQIEALGREFFVRDLESRNGVFLNGHKIRYSQLLPGDALRLGGTTLVFRTGGPPRA